ncbi:hypothetical protein [Desulfurobacterium sp.]|uniref:hypothetical protein n=1 Tax=Desulfurobacterium sp. TaxID=2004706 RepID=UPI00260ACD08|nr:hypothetical protein [Desulfurobacterium sp.]
MLSINQDIKIGNKKFHIQTEYYKTVNKIVSNILQNGLVVKKVEKEVVGISPEDIDKEIKKFHTFVVSRLLQAGQKQKEKVEQKEVVEREVEQAQSVRFELPSHLYGKVVDLVGDYFGIITEEIVNGIISQSTDIIDFIEKLAKEAEAEGADYESIKKKLFRIFADYLLAANVSFNITEMTGKNFVELLRAEALENLLEEEYGILAGQVEEEILAELENASSLDQAIDIVLSRIEDEEKKQKIRENPRILFRI